MSMTADKHPMLYPVLNSRMIPSRKDWMTTRGTGYPGRWAAVRGSGFRRTIVHREMHEVFHVGEVNTHGLRETVGSDGGQREG